MFYATHDYDSFIAEGAEIKAFKTMDEVRDYLLKVYDRHNGWLPETAVIEAVRCADYWLKFKRKPDINSMYCFEPFEDSSDICIAAPGQHPGGNSYWVTPRVDVYAVVSIKNIHDEPEEDDE